MKKNSLEAWRRRLSWWAIPLLVCVLNGVAILFYQIYLAGDVKGLENLVGTEVKNRSILEADQRKSQVFLETVEQSREDVESLYKKHFSTPEERLTDFTREVREMARQAGLEPKSFNYPETEFIGGELRQRDMVFPVQGTYNQLRTFINFLEIGDQFVTLERVTLTGSSGAGGGSLAIQLRLSTIFAPEEAKTPRGSRGPSS